MSLLQNSGGYTKDFVVGLKYRVKRKIGCGSFGDIFLGINITNGEEVAIKMESSKVCLYYNVRIYLLIVFFRLAIHS